MNIQDKTIIITGATGGIGLATAKALCALGAYVIGVGRSEDKCEKAKFMIECKYPDAKISFLIADLSSQTQVKKLIRDIKEKLAEDKRDSIDVLINNAGTFSSWFVTTEDGIELQMAVNHLAPFMLTHGLLETLLRSKDARVLTVSSDSHYKTRIKWKDIQLRKNYFSLRAYKQTKLFNVLFTAELNRRVKEGQNLRAYAIDPGLVNTEIGSKHANKLEKFVWKMRQKKGVEAEKGASTSVYLASEPEIIKDIYWYDSKPKNPSKYSKREYEAKRLWGISEKMCGIDSQKYGLKGVEL